MDEVDLVAAERAVEQQTAARVAQVQGAVSGQGSDDCNDCGDPIDAARRQAAPFAVRCVRCQAAVERQMGRM
jgi:phage/conjugal plasmid C-4 type zinc finger TraR family protein